MYGLINSKTALMNRMNFLMEGELAAKAFEQGAEGIDPTMLTMAVRYYRTLLQLFPEEAVIYGNLGFCYFYLGDYSRAWEAYQHAVILEPQLSTLRWDMAMILFQRGEFKKAAVLWEEYLGQREGFKGYLEAYRKQLKRMNRKDAFSLIQQAERRFAEDEIKTYIKLAESYFLLKEYDKAKNAELHGGLREIKTVSFLKGNVRLHLNTELFFLRHRLHARM